MGAQKKLREARRLVRKRYRAGLMTADEAVAAILAAKGKLPPFAVEACFASENSDEFACLCFECRNKADVYLGVVRPGSIIVGLT